MPKVRIFNEYDIKGDDIAVKTIKTILTELIKLNGNEVKIAYESVM